MGFGLRVLGDVHGSMLRAALSVRLRTLTLNPETSTAKGAGAWRRLWVQVTYQGPAQPALGSLLGAQGVYPKP